MWCSRSETAPPSTRSRGRSGSSRSRSSSARSSTGSGPVSSRPRDGARARCAGPGRARGLPDAPPPIREPAPDRLAGESPTRNARAGVASPDAARGRGVRMRVIAIVNQKGGCGKTTTTVNLAGCLSADGARVLVVDLDPQAHATLALGVDPEAVDENLFEVLTDPDGAARMEDVIVEITQQLSLAPSGIVLSALEQRLASERLETRTERLAAALDRLPDRFDYVLIDCPPSVGLLTFNALRAAGEVIVPLETSHFAIHGVQKLLETIGLLAERIGHDVQVRILPTLYDGRTRYARQTLSEVREMFKDLCFDTVIRQNVKLREAASRGRPINFFARTANGAVDYAALAVEVEATAPRAEVRLPLTPASDPREVVVQFRD